MALRLGEMLVKAGLIKPAQLDEALKSQVIFGGRLGTNLIEMGLIEENELARVLSAKLRVPCADPDELMNIPPQVVGLIPPDMAEKYRVIPFRLENRRLFLVMADPSDLPAIDEIAFRTGFVIVPMVAPEIRLMMALEKYYDIRREVRYLPVSRELGGRRICSYQPRPADSPLLSPREVVDFSAFAGEGDETFPWERDTGETERIEAARRHTIDTLSQSLANPQDRDSVASAILDYMGGLFDRAALLIVTKEAVTGWKGVARGKEIPRFDQVRIGLHEPSVLVSVVRAKTPYLGAVAGTPANLKLLKGLGEENPEGISLVPLIMNNRVVTILCATGLLEQLGARQEDLRIVARKGVLAFEILILRNKILMT